MLARVYGLKDDVSIFLESQGKQDLLLPFQSQEFQLTMAYLVDIFEAFNCLNLLLQGKNTDRMKDYDELRTFIAKLGLWHRRVQRLDIKMLLKNKLTGNSKYLLKYVFNGFVLTEIQACILCLKLCCFVVTSNIYYQ